MPTKDGLGVRAAVTVGTSPLFHPVRPVTRNTPWEQHHVQRQATRGSAVPSPPVAASISFAKQHVVLWGRVVRA